jgi:surfactin synthase thioesterase subunit
MNTPTLCDMLRMIIIISRADIDIANHYQSQQGTALGTPYTACNDRR